MSDNSPALLLIGHGSRSGAGVADYWRLARAVKTASPALQVGCGFIELAHPGLDEAIDDVVAEGATSVVGVPLVLLGAGHLKSDGPAALDRARLRHPGVGFAYARDLGIHPKVLAVASDRIAAALAPGARSGSSAAVVLVGRGSTDPDANADLHKVARLLQDTCGLGWAEPAFVSLAPPSVPAALERCRLLVRDAVGDPDQVPRLDRDTLRIAAAGREADEAGCQTEVLAAGGAVAALSAGLHDVRVDAVAHGPALDPVAELLDVACDLDAERVRQGDREA